MIKKLLLAVSLFTGLCAQAQITSPTASDIGPTSYTNGATNDSIYFFCAGQGSLTATPPSGTPGWTFLWQVFNPTTNSWDPFTVQSGVPTSTISSLNGGLYRVTITDGTLAVVGCYRAWISIVTSPTTVDVAPIAPGCTAFTLNGTINYGSATQIYNPPADPFIISAATTITVCFTANHTYVSDLGFYLVGPAACGSPTITLAPNPGSIGMGAVCNSGNDLSNLCFTTAAAPNFNVCTASTPLTGTFDTYGASSTPINWSGLYGCDATQSGWRVQIYDCIGADVGALTNSTVTFTGTSICGNPSTVTYNSGAINSVINDNSCTAGTASIFTVPPTTATPIPYVGGYIWTANPTIFIPNATSSLTPTINPAPTVNTVFTLTLTGGSVPTCGGNNQDSELFIYTPPVAPVIDPVAALCTTSPAFNLTANPSGGTWGGPGITNTSLGTFNPSILGAGTYTVTYTAPGSCGGTDTEQITIGTSSDPTIIPAGPFCTTDSPTQLFAASNGGTWSGPGITDPILGTFDPSVATVGNNTVTYTTSGTCTSSDTEVIQVILNTSSIDPVAPVCLNDAPFNLTSPIAGGVWSGNGITNSALGTFDPSSGTGNHVITYTVGTTCPAASTITVVVNGLPTANAGNDASFCAGGSTTLNASGGVSYSWSPTTGLVPPTNVSNPVASPAATQVYTVTVTDGNGCSATDNVTVTVNQLPNVSAGNATSVCPGGSANLNASGASSYVWSPATNLSDPNISNPVATPSGTTTYTVTGTDANGCVNTSTVTVTVNGITASFTATPASGIEPLPVSFDNTSTNAVSYFWSYGDGNTQVTSNDTTSNLYMVQGTYTVMMIATNAQGCVDTAYATIVVTEDFSLLIPNVFSPNGDGVNDNFEIVSTGIASMSMVVFDRWGIEIASFNAPTGKWDGTYKNKDMPEGTYFFVFTAVAQSGAEHKQNGTVTLLRK